jgi:flagellar motor switch/type III secretory pathway protein FliN
VTIAVREWLPHAAFTEDAVRPVLAGPIAAWGARWFVEGLPQMTSVRHPECESRPAQCLQVQGKNCHAGLSGRAKRALVEAALGVDLSGLTLMESDHKILDSFATEAISDLLGALDDIGDGSAGDVLFSITIALGGKEIAVVALSCQALIPAMKAAIGPRRRSEKPLGSRTEALKPAKLVAQGVLGHAELTLDELKDLVVGDVIILDNSLQNPVELRLPNTEQPVARGKLVRMTNQVSIQI